VSAWRDWLLGNRGRRSRKTTIAIASDVWERASRRKPVTLPAIVDVETTALEVYAAHGLPTQHGHYQRAPGAAEWTWLAEELPAELRWAMVLERPLEHGWRYATLEDIGRFPDAAAELLAAANLLSGCRHLKDRATGREPGEPGDDIQTSIRLGFEWHALRGAMAWKEKARLKLTTPSDALAAPKGESEPSGEAEAPPSVRQQAERDLGAAPTSVKPPRKPRKPRKPKAD
jgi:hypothetical protein